MRTLLGVFEHELDDAVDLGLDALDGTRVAVGQPLPFST